jgi:predicted RNase H-like nuclease (RuvC/YqgF family)
MPAQQEYFDALNRLIKGKNINTPKGTKISNDTVALEAGRKRGSIKKNRIVNYELIEAIKKASEEHKRPDNGSKEKIDKLKRESIEYRELWEEAIARELSLIYEVNELKKELEAFKNKRVTRLNINKTQL